MSNKYVQYVKAGVPVIEGPFDDFRLEARVHELLELEDVTKVVVTTGNLEEEREEYLSDVGFTD